MSKNINVLVVVDTVNINSDNLNQTIVLVDDNLDEDATPRESGTFVIKCQNGDTVQFRITAVNETTGVSFKKFEWKDDSSDQHCFDPLPDSDNNWTGTAVGEAGQHEDFFIKISVDGKGPFKLDPQIRLKP